jgi:hypothetical protein
MKLTMAALGALGLLCPAAAAAQQLEATVLAQAATYRLRATGAVEQHSLTYPGAALGIRLGGMRIRLEGLFGSVSSGSASAFTIRTTTLSAGVRAGAVELGVEAVARHRTAAGGASNTLVRLGGVYGAVLPDFGAGLSGLASVSLYPVRSAVNTDPLSMAMRAEIGARFTPSGGPVSFFTAYRLLRIDYRRVGGAAQRLEQDAGMFVGVTYSGR